MDTTQSSGTLAIISEQQISPYMKLVLLKSIPSNPGTILAFNKKFHFDITNLVAKCYTEVSPEYDSKKRTENHETLSILELESTGLYVIWSITYHTARETQLGVRKSAREWQYQLLNDAHEDVGVRPSLW